MLHCAESQSAPTLSQDSLFKGRRQYRNRRHFFEWWYIDVTLKNGYQIVVVFYMPLYTFRSQKPLTIVEVYGPRGEKIEHGMCMEKRSKGLKNSGGVAIGTNYFKGQYPEYKLFWKNDKIELDLVFKNQMKSWKLGTGLLFRDEKTERYFNWVVPVPRATVSGSLKIKDRFIEVDGVGYHDHNWGNFVLKDVFSWWYWGRIFTDEYTIIYAKIEENKSGHITPFMMARKGEVVISTNKVEILQDYWTCKNTDTIFPQQCKMKVANGKEQIELTTKVRKIIENTEFFFNPFQSPFPRKLLNNILDGSNFISHIPVLTAMTKYFLGKSVYLRLLVDYDLRLNSRERFTGSSIQEIMLLRLSF